MAGRLQEVSPRIGGTFCHDLQTGGRQTQDVGSFFVPSTTLAVGSVSFEFPFLGGKRTICRATPEVSSAPISVVRRRGTDDEEDKGQADAAADLEPVLDTSLAASMNARSFGASDAPRGK